MSEAVRGMGLADRLATTRRCRGRVRASVRSTASGGARVPPVRSSAEGLNADQIKAVARQRYDGNTWRSPASTLNRFANVMTLGDVIFVPTDHRKEYLVGKVAGEYKYAQAPIFKGYLHWRRVTWLGRTPLEGLPGEAIPNLSSRNMLIQPRAQDRLMRWVEDFGKV